MALGEDDCGIGLCGLDVMNFSALARPTAPAALAFDGLKKDFELDDDGRFVGSHPVDAKVFILCRTAIGSIKSASTTGQTLSNLEFIDKQRIQAQAEDAFRVVLAPVIAAGEIELLDIEVDATIRGRVLVRPNYKNLVSGRPRPSTFPFV